MNNFTATGADSSETSGGRGGSTPLLAWERARRARSTHGGFTNVLTIHASPTGDAAMLV